MVDQSIALAFGKIHTDSTTGMLARLSAPGITLLELLIVQPLQETGENIEELQKRIRVEQQKIERSQYKIRRIQEGYEADPPVYTADEVKEKIGIYRDLISRTEAEIHRLHEIVEQKAITKQTKEEALRILESLRDTNLEKASFDEKLDLVAKLGIKVYPSEDGKIVRISSTLQFAPSPLKLSPQIISIASPKL